MINKTGQATVGKGLPLILLAGAMFGGGSVFAGEGDTPEERTNLKEPLFRVSRQNDQLATAATRSPLNIQEPQQQEHPLVPAIQMARECLNKIDEIRDYSCTLFKRERIDGKLNEHEAMHLKVRHKPFSVYMYFRKPHAVRGRECIYGAQHGKLIAHEGQGIKAKLGTFRLDPTGMLAMRGQRYPITEVGIRRLTTRLIDVAEHDTKFGECNVQWFKDTKVGDRVTTLLQVTHPVPRKEFRFHVARVYMDNEYQIPIRYESYLWPKREGGNPVLDEEYTYTALKFNNDFNDADFAEVNPQYRFVQ